MCDFEAWVHKEVSTLIKKKHSGVGGQSCTQSDTLQNHPTGTSQCSKQAAHEAKCLISDADLDSYNAFRGTAETQTNESGSTCHRHKVTIKWIQKYMAEVEGLRSSLRAVSERRPNSTGLPSRRRYLTTLFGVNDPAVCFTARVFVFLCPCLSAAENNWDSL